MTLTLNSISFLKQEHNVKTEKNTCFDCLHCKVSAKSTSDIKLFFCSKTKNKEQHKETYWLESKVCSQFEDMST